MQCLLVGLLAAGCTEMPTYNETTSEISVSNYVGSGCSTSVVVGLSKQIADEVGCMVPGSLVKIQPGGNLTFTSNAVLPYLSGSTKTALDRVTNTSSIQLNSSYRTVVQQYLLYRWYQQGRCGITAAAQPGRSNHESGKSLDIENYSARRTVLVNNGFAASVPGDPVHFDYSSSADLRGKDTMAFQRLWNRNNPNDQIDEDGIWGSDTQARMNSAPATGFPIGASCNSPSTPTNPSPGTPIMASEVVSVDGPDRVAPNAHAAYSITIANMGNVAIPAAAQIVTTNGQPSELYDANSWTSPTMVGTLGLSIAPGATGTIDVDVETPNVTEETVIFSQFSLKSGGDTFGTLDVALTVTPNGDDGDSSEGEDNHDDGTDAPPEVIEGAEVTGGCSTGGTAGGAFMFLPLGFVAMRRRRR